MVKNPNSKYSAFVAMFDNLSEYDFCGDYLGKFTFNQTKISIFGRYDAENRVYEVKIKIGDNESIVRGSHDQCLINTFTKFCEGFNTNVNPEIESIFY